MMGGGPPLKRPRACSDLSSAHGGGDDNPDDGSDGVHAAAGGASGGSSSSGSGSGSGSDDDEEAWGDLTEQLAVAGAPKPPPLRAAPGGSSLERMLAGFGWGAPAAAAHAAAAPPAPAHAADAPPQPAFHLLAKLLSTSLPAGMRPAGAGT